MVFLTTTRRRSLFITIVLVLVAVGLGLAHRRAQAAGAERSVFASLTQLAQRTELNLAGWLRGKPPNTANAVASTAVAPPMFATFTVTKTADTNDGVCDADCSLREAITAANANAGADTIEFNLGAGTPTISPTSALPTITEAVTINGNTGGSTRVELNGAGVGAGVSGLTITAGSSTISGLVINRFTANGILLQTNGSNIVNNCYIGTDAAGTTASANAGVGININNVPNNTIGGTTAGERNVISGNSGNGVSISGVGATGNKVSGNYIGTNANGVGSLANNSGIVIGNASNNTIGGTTAGERNIISNNSYGVYFSSFNDGNNNFPAVSGNKVIGNYIGTDVTGTVDLGNAGIGVRFSGGNNNTVGGTTAGERNVISGNGYGVTLEPGPVGTTGNLIIGNYIGTDASGTLDLGNDIYGVNIDRVANNTVGGTTAGERNIISGNNNHGVSVGGTDATGNKIIGNYIGTNAAGTAAIGNTINGVVLSASANNFVGGTTAGERNIISGNNGYGVHVTIGSGNKITGNYIGTDVNGTADLGNNSSGVRLDGTTNTLGGTTAGERNIISGNNEHGVLLFSGSTSNKVIGNYIGTDVNGTADLGNTLDGVQIDRAASHTIGGTAAGEGNVISGNNDDGVEITGSAATGNKVSGNYIGTNAAGTSALGNADDGVAIVSGASTNTIGGITAGERNVISGNGFNGVSISGTTAMGNKVIGNYIGTNAAGTAALANSRGVLISSAPSNNIGGGNAGEGNLISGNSLDGVLINGNISGTDATGNKISGNYIGTDATGASSLFNMTDGVQIQAASNTVGGTTAGERNVISGNHGNGVQIVGTFSAYSNKVIGNYIGLNAAGTTSLGNLLDGVNVGGGQSASSNTVGGTTAGERNIISGNSANGVTVINGGSSANKVIGNYIGTDVTGALDRGNTGNGVNINGATSTAVGGTSAGEPNLIFGNDGRGVYVAAGTSNKILANSIFSNTGLGLDLGTIGITANDSLDPDAGANNLQNFPVLSCIASANGSTTIQGTLNSLANTTFRIEFFSNDTCDSSGNGEGQTFLGSANVMTNGSGDATINASIAQAVAAGKFITATATKLDGSSNPVETSEFSACQAVVAPTLAISDVTLSEGNSGTTNFNFTVTLTGAQNSCLPVTVNYMTADDTALLADNDYALTSGMLTFNTPHASNSITQMITVPITGDVLFEGDETFFVNLSSDVGATLADNQGQGTINNDDNGPTITRSNAAVTVNEGSVAANSGTFNDPQGNNTVTLMASLGTVTKDDTLGTWSWTYTAPDGPAGPTTVTITASDGSSMATATFDLTINNVAPKLNQCGPPSFTLVQTSIAGWDTAAADFDNDGDQDIVTTSPNGGAGPLFYRNNGGGNFTQVANIGQGHGYPLTTANVNGDANQDVIFFGHGLVRLGDGAFGFTNGASFTQTNTNGVYVDVSGDGVKDLVVGSFAADGKVAVHLGNGVGGFGASTNYTVLAGSNIYIALADFTGDGKPEIATSRQNDGMVTLLINNGSGSFTTGGSFAVGTNPRGLAAGDFNNDGKQDLAVANNGASDVSILLGNGTGSFSAATSVSVGAGPHFILVTDFNNDGKQDLAVARANRATVLAGNGDGSFGMPTDYGTQSQLRNIFLADMNNDNAVDIVLGQESLVEFVQANVAPTTVTVNEGATAMNSGTFCDPGVDTVTITASIGTVTQNDGAGTWSWSFATNDGPAQNQMVTITATDSDGAMTTYKFNLVVNNINPTATFANGGAVSEGSTGSVSFTNQADVSVPDTSAGFRYAYDFNNDGTFDSGDGTYAGSAVPTASATVPASFLTDGPATRTVKGRIIDKDGGFTDYTTMITINNVAPTIALTGNSSVNAGVSYTLNLGAITDPGMDTVTSYSINWGDGNTENFPSSNPANTSKMHTYTTAGGQTITVSLTDEDGAHSNAGTKMITVNTSLTISDVMLNEGNSSTTSFDFVVTLSPASAQTVTVNYATAIGSATAPGDFTALPATMLTFMPNEVSKTISVQVKGETDFEPDETFFVNLSGATNATIADGQGVGTIKNDDGVPPELKVGLIDPAVCLGPGGLIGVSAELTNPNLIAVNASWTATFPAQLLGLVGSGTATVNQAAMQVTTLQASWTGTLNPGQTVAFTYQAQIAPNTPLDAQLCVSNSANFNGGTAVVVPECFVANCPQTGLLPLANVRAGGQKAGSFLVFPYFTSKTATQSDTRLSLSNIGTQQAYVHLFLVDGASCDPADLFLCLTPNATFSFKTSEYDPENTGFVYAVAVDNQGRPVPNNGLIGNAFVRDGGYVDNYAAEAFWRYDTNPTTVNNGVALLHLNGGIYDAAPVQFSVELQSPVDTVGQRIVVAPLAGDLSGIANLNAVNPTLQAAAGQLGIGLASNEQEKTVSFSTMLSGGCLKSATIGTTFPRVPNGLGLLIPTGKAGYLQFRVGAGVGLLMTPRTGNNKWSGIRTLHKTAMSNTVIAIPVITPVC